MTELFHCLLAIQFNLGDAAIDAAIGHLIVFAGMIVLVLLFTGLGAVMKRINGKKKPKAPVSEPLPMPPVRVVEEKHDEIAPEVVAAIAAALTAYYCDENKCGETGTKCSFVVKRIKKL